IPRSFSLWLAETPAIVMGRPVRPCSAAAWRSKSLITAAPTGPRPAIPMRKGGGMNRAAAGEGVGKGSKNSNGASCRVSRDNQGTAEDSAMGFGTQNQTCAKPAKAYIDG